MPQGRISAGHPVDVATGILFDSATDVELPGRFELAFVRHYSTALIGLPPGCLGPGWSTGFECWLVVDDRSVTMRCDDGTEIGFDGGRAVLEAGAVLRNLGAFSEVVRAGARLIVTQWDSAAHDCRRYVFDANTPAPKARLVAIEDVTGQGVDLGYAPDGALSAVTQRREGRSLRFAYLSDGRLRAVSMRARDGAERPLLELAYDAAGCLAEVAHAGGYRERYEYDDALRLVREVNRTGGVFHFRYDAAGRCVKATGLGDYDLKVFRYLPSVRWTEVTDSTGAVRRYEWNAAGQVVREASPSGAVITTDFDAHGRIVAETDALGGVTRTQYDDAGNRAAIVDPIGRVTRFRYDPRRQLVEFVDAAGGSWRFAYDGRGVLAGTVDPAGVRWSCRANVHGEIVEATDASGASQRYAYDDSGNVLEHVDWEGHPTRYEYDAWGSIVARTAPDGGRTMYRYDLLLRPVEIRGPDGAITRFTYDGASNLTAILDEHGPVKSMRYGTCSRLAEYAVRGGERLGFTWTTEPQRLASVTNGRDEVWSYEYDDEGRLTAETDFGGRRTAYAYGPGYLPDRITLPDGQVVTIVRDGLGRETERRLADGTTVRYTYDALGNIASATNADAAVSFERDATGRVVRETCNGRGIESRYDPLGHRVERIVDGADRLQIERDRNGAPVGYRGFGREPIALRRDSVGREVSRRFAAGVSVEQAYDPSGRRVSQAVSRVDSAFAAAGAGATALVTRTLDFDERRHLARVDDSRRGTTRYQHDEAGRLRAVVAASGAAERYEYDEVGDRRSLHRARGPDTVADEVTVDYGPGGTLIRHGASRYEHDACGRPIRKTTVGDDGSVRAWEYGWNGEGWLAWVRCPDGRRWTYRYDAFGRRVGKSTDGRTVDVVWDGDQVAAAVESGGHARVSWLFDAEGFAPIAVRRDDRTWYCVADPAGRPLEWVDADGRIVASDAGTAWGALAAGAEAPPTEFALGFEGQWRDAETGLHYNRFRYYDPETARYLTPDPYGLFADPNAYRYVPSPLEWVDPYGLDQVTTTVGNRDYVFDRDARGRTVRAEGPLCNPNRIENEHRSTSAQKRIAGGTGDHAGHLIGNQFGGPGGDENLVRMCPTLNLGKWKRMENQLVGLTKNNSVRVVVTVHYKGNSTKPAKFTVDAYVTDRNGKVTRKRWQHKNC